MTKYKKYEKKKTKKIAEFKEEIKTLKISNTEKIATKKSFCSKQNTDSKNMNLASTTSGG